MYNYLLLASFGKTEGTKLDNVINAIQLPVLSIEVSAFIALTFVENKN